MVPSGMLTSRRPSFTAILGLHSREKAGAKEEKYVCHIGLIYEHTWHPQKLQKILGDSMEERGYTIENDTKILLVKANIFI